MITVRFPTGFSIQFNAATWVVWYPDGTASIYQDRTKTTLFAVAPKEALVEFSRPCRAYDAREAPDDVAETFHRLLTDRKTFGWDTLRDIKRELQRYDSVRRRWKS
jgi:hypothetical protein